MLIFNLIPMKKVAITLGVLFFLLIASLFIFAKMLDMGIDKDKLKKEMAASKLPFSTKIYETVYGKVKAIEVGKDTTLPLMIFVHGSPGSWDAFSKYLLDSSLQVKFRMISVDRLGYGGSNKGIPEGSLFKQAAILEPIVKENIFHQKVILVGHSYGGPTIARFAMDYPNLVQKLIFIAPSIDPEQEKVLWYQRFAATKLITNILSSDINVCNREILPLKKELTDMLPLWKNITASVMYFHGKKDKLVPYANASFAQKQLAHVPFELIDFPKENHFIPWTQFEVIKKKMLELPL